MDVGKNGFNPAKKSIIDRNKSGNLTTDVGKKAYYGSPTINSMANNIINRRSGAGT